MNFMGFNKLWFGISAVLIVPGILALVAWGLRLGIDFTGGSLIELRFPDSRFPAAAGPRLGGGQIPDSDQSGSENQTLTARVEEALKASGVETPLVQEAGQGSVLIRTEPVNQDQHAAMLQTIGETVGEHQEVRFETVGPTISQDLTRKAVGAVAAAAVAIILYIAWSFRGVPKPASSWRFGVAAVLALLHDLLFVVGAFAILGHFAGFEVDGLFITALLTVMGFSVHDTIVVFDRMRENLKKFPRLRFADTVNLSLTQTLARSLGTSLTVLLVLLALYLLGPSTIQPFVLALLLGITIGTYSSIFFATPLVVVWQNALNRRNTSR